MDLSDASARPFESSAICKVRKRLIPLVSPTLCRPKSMLVQCLCKFPIVCYEIQIRVITIVSTETNSEFITAHKTYLPE